MACGEDACIDGGTKAALPLEAENPHIDKPTGRLRYDTIRRGIIDNENFGPCRRIPSHAYQTAMQQIGSIMTGDDDGHRGRHAIPPVAGLRGAVAGWRR